MRVLVVIANYGKKNIPFLERLLREYRSMTFDVALTVLSNIPKDLGPDVEVIVGLPAKDPWSLPFGYKDVFLKRANDYDLFIYSEDDTLIEERNILAFLQVTRILPDDKIAGFLRHEIARDGTKYYSTIHGHYHWDPNSVVKAGEDIFARYTNDHSACFILTQEQLKRAIQSGGFLSPPRQGRYDMLVTAATEPYTQCGMKKVICISRINDFCLHHLPDIYLGRIGLNAREADREMEKLKTLPESDEIRGPLFNTTTKLEDASWDRKYYESCRVDLVSLIPEGVERILSVGCGCGSTEAALVARGVEVWGIPLDCIIQVSAAARGVRILPPSFDGARTALGGKRFDCIILSDVLQYLQGPASVIRELRGSLDRNGCMVISVPNCDHPAVLRKRLSGLVPLFCRGSSDLFEKYGLHFTTRRLLDSWLEESGFEVAKVYRQVEPRFERIDRLTLGAMNQYLLRSILVLAKRRE